MVWWRQKADDQHNSDQILDLDTIVWRGINQFDRMNKLAEAAAQAEHQEVEAPKSSLPSPSLTSAPLPTVPLPAPDKIGQDEAEIVSALEQSAGHQSATEKMIEEEMIEEEIRQQIISDAMSAVLAFQEGGGKKSDLHAHIEQEVHQQLAINEQSFEADETDQPKASNQPETNPVPADMSGAIRSVVIDEIGGWLTQNMSRIVAETIEQIPAAASKPSGKPSGKAAGKADGKSSNKTAAGSSKPAVPKKPAAVKAKKSAKRITKTTAKKTTVKQANKSAKKAAKK